MAIIADKSVRATQSQEKDEDSLGNDATFLSNVEAESMARQTKRNKGASSSQRGEDKKRKFPVNDLPDNVFPSDIDDYYKEKYNNVNDWKRDQVN